MTEVSTWQDDSPQVLMQALTQVPQRRYLVDAITGHNQVTKEGRLSWMLWVGLAQSVERL